MSSENFDLKSMLIQELQAHPSLWDKQCTDYKDLTVKCNAWNEILDNLRSSTQDPNILETRLRSVESLQKYWRSTRDFYTREKKMVRGKSGTGLDEVQSDWPYFTSMQFLDQSDVYKGGEEGASSCINARQQEEDEGDAGDDEDENVEQNQGASDEEEGGGNQLHQMSPSFSEPEGSKPGEFKQIRVKNYLTSTHLMLSLMTGDHSHTTYLEWSSYSTQKLKSHLTISPPLIG